MSEQGAREIADSANAVAALAAAFRRVGAVRLPRKKIRRYARSLMRAHQP